MKIIISSISPTLIVLLGFILLSSGKFNNFIGGPYGVGEVIILFYVYVTILIIQAIVSLLAAIIIWRSGNRNLWIPFITSLFIVAMVLCYPMLKQFFTPYIPIGGLVIIMLTHLLVSGRLKRVN